MALTAGIGLITALLVNRAERDMVKAQQHRELSESAQTAAVLSRRVLELQRALRAVSAQLDPATVDDPAALARFVEGEAVLRGLFTNVFVASIDGQMRAFADETGVRWSELNLSDRPYFQRTLTEHRAEVSEPTAGRLSGDPVIVFTQPVSSIDGIYAVLGGALRLADRNMVADLADVRDDDADALLVVSDAQGRILAHPDRSRLMQPLSAEPRLAQAFAAWTRDGSPLEPAGLSLPQAGEIVSASGVAGPNWMVWRARPERELLAPLRAARRDAMAWAGAVIALLSAALLIFLWRLLRPLVLLEQRAQHLFDGQLDAQAGWPTTHGEIGRLGRVLRHVGAERAQLESFNAQVLRKLGSVMSAAPLGIAFTRDRLFELVSAELCRLIGREEHELLGQSIEVMFAADAEQPAFWHTVDAAFDGDRPYVGEWQLQRGDGSRFWASLRGKPVEASDRKAGSIWTINDISDQRVAREELEWSAGHDSLTGLANRMTFELHATRVVKALPRSLPAAVVFIDLDHFKPINDGAGHAAGDAMLRAVAAAMTSKVRASDLVVRLGGDEFALLLEGCSPEAALRIAQSVRAEITAIALPWAQRVLTVGASLGVAPLQPGMLTLTAWVEAADAACYAAKAAGRGSVRIASDQSAALPPPPLPPRKPASATT